MTVTAQQQHWKLKINRAMLSKYKEKIISNLEFYTQPNHHSSIRVE